jgi:hypothetical protein
MALQAQILPTHFGGDSVNGNAKWNGVHFERRAPSDLARGFLSSSLTWITTGDQLFNNNLNPVFVSSHYTVLSSNSSASYLS